MDKRLTIVHPVAVLEGVHIFDIEYCFLSYCLVEPECADPLLENISTARYEIRRSHRYYVYLV